MGVLINPYYYKEYMETTMEQVKPGIIATHTTLSEHEKKMILKSNALTELAKAIKADWTLEGGANGSWIWINKKNKKGYTQRYIGIHPSQMLFNLNSNRTAKENEVRIEDNFKAEYEEILTLMESKVTPLEIEGFVDD